MSTHKYFDRICAAVLVLALLLTVLFVNAERLGIQRASAGPGYESRLFDDARVHTIDLVMDDWEAFLADCKSEEYSPCSVVIDDEVYKNVAIRGKGNTSLTQVEAYGNNRYSFKLEFDHYDSAKTYYGLEKLCLNNIIQDNTYMKDYLTYRMMAEMGVASPLCSYVYLTVNGEDWGLYLAVEGVEESFLTRNYGSDYGELYKPDSTNPGGQMQGERADSTFPDPPEGNAVFPSGTGGRPDGITPPEGNAAFPSDTGGRPDGTAPPKDRDRAENPDSGTENDPPQNFQMPDNPMQAGMGSSDDLLLKYIDEDADSYPNIFDHAKTDISNADRARLIRSLKHLSSGEELESTVDTDAVIRYFVVHNFVLNYDSYTGSMVHNYYLYEKDGQLQMIPWDYNLAFGGFSSGDSAKTLVNAPIDSPVSGGSTQERPMIAWIFEHEEYTERYHQYFDEWISEYFDSGYFETMIDNVEDMIAPFVEKDPTKFCTYEQFETGVETLREFCLLRAQSVRAQLDGAIGSTSETQEGGTLIETGDLQISDMGGMEPSIGDAFPIKDKERE